MIHSVKIVFLIFLTVTVLNGCSVSTSQQKVEKYPRKTMVNDERKAGPQMFFYEAAETDADPNNVIVVPPGDKGEEDTQ